MSGRFADNPDYVAYERLLLRLQELNGAGLSDSEEAAESVRDVMDGHWRGLDAEERKRLSGLSADLYMLSGEEIFESSAPPGQSPEQRRLGLAEAKVGGDARRALALLRIGPYFVPERDVAAVRAWAYDLLGHPDAANAFKAHATGIVLPGRSDPSPIVREPWQRGVG